MTLPFLLRLFAGVSFSGWSSHKFCLTKSLAPCLKWNVKTFVGSCFLCGCEVCPLISIPICCLKSMLFNPISMFKKKKQKENTGAFLAQRDSNRKTCLNFLIKASEPLRFIHCLCRSSGGHKIQGQ